MNQTIDRVLDAFLCGTAARGRTVESDGTMLRSNGVLIARRVPIDDSPQGQEQVVLELLRLDTSDTIARHIRMLARKADVVINKSATQLQEL